MRRFASWPAAAAALLMLAGCTPQEPPSIPFRVVATSKEVMNAITIPASDVIWSVPGEPPASDEAWLAVEHAALALAESGNLLLMDGRAVDQEEWARNAVALIDAAQAALEAARARDMDRMFDVGDEIYTVCETCHRRYLPGASS
ncbi:MAG: hypothetical protein DIU71_13465 [Proteobacteria bacterium]|nr:MAG: hypothetical protein DIU71_13465 [Pseudomonadota bacterium]